MRRSFETPKSLKPGQVAFDGALPLHQAQGVNGTSPEVQPVHLRCPPSQACGRLTRLRFRDQEVCRAWRSGLESALEASCGLQVPYKGT